MKSQAGPKARQLEVGPPILLILTILTVMRIDFYCIRLTSFGWNAVDLIGVMVFD